MRASCVDLVAFISGRYGGAAEVGIGFIADVCLALKQRGVAVFATDIHPVPVDGIDIVYDDVTDPNLSLYQERDVIYSVRPPPELVPYLQRLARTIHSDLVIKPLSSDHLEGPLIGNGRGGFFYWSYP